MKHPLFEKIHRTYKRAKALKKAAGAILINGKHVADTYQCNHCSAHRIFLEGVNKIKICKGCKQQICESSLCAGDCIVLEARLEGWEKGFNRVQILQKLASRKSYSLKSGIFI